MHFPSQPSFQHHCPFHRHHPSHASLQHSPKVSFCLPSKSTSVLPPLSSLVEFPLKWQPKCHHFLHEFSIICSVSYELFLFQNHTAKFIFTCVHEDASQASFFHNRFCVIPSVLHMNLLNILLDFSTWITYRHLKFTCLLFISFITYKYFFSLFNCMFLYL